LSVRARQAIGKRLHIFDKIIEEWPLFIDFAAKAVFPPAE
jgi:hypothetical protein